MTRDSHPARRRPALTRRRLVLAGGSAGAVVALGVGTDLLRGGNGSLGLVGAEPIGPHSPEVLAAERRRAATGRVVRRTLTARPATLDLAGRRVDTWAFDDTYPAHELRVTHGDLLRVDLRNELPDPTTVHWHGLALRNDMDGVPGVTMDAVAPGDRFGYGFLAPHPGTYWFHPHVGIQLDTGLLGPLVIEDPAEPLDYDADVVLVLDDWTDGVGRSPKAILAAQSRDGMSGMGSMGPMDPVDSLSAPGTATPEQPIGDDTGDVAYPLHLVNGRSPADPHVVRARPGQRLRLRLVNAGSDTAYRVAVGGHPLTVVAADGFPVEPVRVDTVLLGMGERYDVLVTARAGAFPVLARPEGKQDPTGLAVLRTSDTAPTPTATAPELAGHLLRYTDLTPTDDVALPARAPDREHGVSLTMADGGRRWLLNGHTYADREPLLTRPGERVRLRLENRSTMFHPMHLHGHTFAIVRNGRPGVRKDTVNVVPGQRLVVDVEADNPGQWLLHCHNAYHGELGMMGVLSYTH